MTSSEWTYTEGRTFTRGTIDLVYRGAKLPVHIDVLADTSRLVAGMYETDPNMTKIHVFNSLPPRGLDTFLTRIVYREREPDERHTFQDVFEATAIMAFFDVDATHFHWLDIGMSSVIQNPLKDSATTSTVPTYACLGPSILPQPGTPAWEAVVDFRETIQVYLPMTWKLLKISRFEGPVVDDGTAINAWTRAGGTLSVRNAWAVYTLRTYTLSHQLGSMSALVTEMRYRRKCAIFAKRPPPFGTMSKYCRADLDDIRKCMDEEADERLAEIMGGSLDKLYALYEEITEHMVPHQNSSWISFKTNGEIKDRAKTIATPASFLVPISKCIASCVYRRYRFHHDDICLVHVSSMVGVPLVVEWRMRLIDLFAHVTPSVEQMSAS
jgi:hypothetical protein